MKTTDLTLFAVEMDEATMLIELLKDAQRALTAVEMNLEDDMGYRDSQPARLALKARRDVLWTIEARLWKHRHTMRRAGEGQ